MKKKIGIIGGADPAASCLLYRKIISICLKRDDCKDGEDFPEIVIINYPFAHIMQTTQANRLKTVAINQVQYCVDKLEAHGVDLLAMACNTYHALFKHVTMNKQKLVHIADSAIEHAKAQGYKRLLILGTDMTIKSNVYNDETVELVVPNNNDQVLVDAVIEKVQQGKYSEAEAKTLNTIINNAYQEKIFDAVVLACTDLPALHEQFPLQQKIGDKRIVIIDTLETLAQELVLEAFNIGV